VTRRRPALARLHGLLLPLWVVLLSGCPVGDSAVLRSKELSSAGDMEGLRAHLRELQAQGSEPSTAKAIACDGLARACRTEAERLLEARDLVGLQALQQATANDSVLGVEHELVMPQLVFSLYRDRLPEAAKARMAGDLCLMLAEHMDPAKPTLYFVRRRERALGPPAADEPTNLSQLYERLNEDAQASKPAAEHVISADEALTAEREAERVEVFVDVLREGLRPWVDDGLLVVEPLGERDPAGLCLIEVASVVRSDSYFYSCVQGSGEAKRFRGFLSQLEVEHEVTARVDDEEYGGMPSRLDVYPDTPTSSREIEVRSEVPAWTPYGEWLDSATGAAAHAYIASLGLGE
jgi:hypothetical protein